MATRWRLLKIDCERVDVSPLMFLVAVVRFEDMVAKQALEYLILVALLLNF